MHTKKKIFGLVFGINSSSSISVGTAMIMIDKGNNFALFETKNSTLSSFKSSKTNISPKTKCAAWCLQDTSCQYFQHVNDVCTVWTKWRSYWLWRKKEGKKKGRNKEMKKCIRWCEERSFRYVVTSNSGHMVENLLSWTLLHLTNFRQFELQRPNWRVKWFIQATQKWK